MDGSESGFGSYYHPHHLPHAATSAAGNGMFSPPSSISEANSLVFPHPVSGRASAAPSVPTESVRRKRGRPRKYGPSPSPPSSASTSTAAVKKDSRSLPLLSPDSSGKKETASSSKKAQLAALGNAGQGFTPHVITIAAGEDVAQKIMSFMQQRKRAFCILSASGSISNASLRQPAMLGGNVSYEGRFEILSLSGSFLHTLTGGASSRTGGLSICLSGTDGRVVGGGVGGPLIAAGPVQVIAGSFLIYDMDSSEITRGDTYVSTLSTPVLVGNTLVSPVNFRSTPDSTGRITTIRGSDDHQSVGGSGSSFMLPSRSMHVMPSRASTDWIGGYMESGLGGL